MPQALRPTRPILPPQLQAILDSLTLFPVGGATVPSAAATTKALRAARSARKVPVKNTAEETLNELDKALGIEAPPVTEAIKKGTRRIRTENPAVKAEVDEFAQAMKALPEAPTSPPPALPTAAPIAIRLNPYWKVTIHGLRNIDPGKTYVIVANHQSLGDIAIMYQTRMQFKWVAKESLFRVPFIGWNMRPARHICLARGNFSSIKKVYREAAGWLKDGMSVFFFPEGTRSPDGRVGKFNDGAFHLAIKAQVPILPIAVEGSYGCLPKKSWRFGKPSDVQVKVLPEVPTAGLTKDEAFVGPDNGLFSWVLRNEPDAEARSSKMKSFGAQRSVLPSTGGTFLPPWLRTRQRACRQRHWGHHGSPTLQNGAR